MPRRRNTSKAHGILHILEMQIGLLGNIGRIALLWDVYLPENALCIILKYQTENIRFASFVLHTLRLRGNLYKCILYLKMYAE